jgi:hypothetical protein
MQALELLRNRLLGSFISRFSVGDTWKFYIDGYWLVAQEVLSEDETFLNKLLQENYTYFSSTVDKEYISKSAIVTAAMRREIAGIDLDELYNLKLEFENQFKLIFPTNVEIVDWQWCLNKTGTDPYRDYLIACFWEGEIQVNEKQD